MKTVLAKVGSAANKIRQNTLFIGIASLIWLLYRSGTKPSRVKYPCQQACLANVSLYISPAILPFVHRLIRVRETLTVRAVLRAACMVTLFFSCLLLIEAIAERVPALFAPPVGEEMRQHGAMGIRLNAENSLDRPVYATSPQALQLPVPNRVVSVHDSRATNWDYQTDYHWQTIDQEIVNDMVARGVMALTERTNTVQAWNDLIPYQPGEEVVIKLNFNNAGCSGYNNKIDGYPEPVNAVIDGLTSIGVPPENIWITDPSRVVPARFRDRITNPDVQYYSYGSCGGPNYHAVDYVDSDSPHASVAQCPAGEKIRPSQVFVDAEHLINIPLFKSHGSYITLAFKNHYGSVIYRDNTLESMHAYFNQWGNTGGCDLETENILADINNNPHIRDKTRLVIGDGLFGNPYISWDSIERWDIFNNDDPNILFFSIDPVAITSVMTDYIVAERGTQDHEHLHAAANLGLGVHDHWDSFENKHYSVIDYQIIDFDTLGVNLHGEPAAEAIHLTWEVEGVLPVTTTWQITYDGLAGDQPSPITGIISPTRAYTLTGLTNDTWYTVTLNAMLDSTPWLTDTVRVMPTAPLDWISVTAVSDVASVYPGETATYTLSVVASEGFTDPVTLTLQGEPTGVSVVFDPNPVTPPGTSQLLITTTLPTIADTYLMTVTGTSGAVSDTHIITLSVSPVPPTVLSISGLTVGVVDTSYAFTATVSPVTATQPITYIWQATDLDTVTHTGGDLDDTATFTWTTTGPKAITVTANNAAGSMTGTVYTLIISDSSSGKVYLPIVLLTDPVSRSRLLPPDLTIQRKTADLEIPRERFVNYSLWEIVGFLSLPLLLVSIVTVTWLLLAPRG